MRFSSRNPESARQQRREQSKRDRAAAQTLRSAFPAVERVRVDLSFQGAAPPAPAAQSHVLHPPARAFFEFPCPYADCDGQFDLNAVAAGVMTSATPHAHGTLECTGARARENTLKPPCRLRVTYTVEAHYKTGAATQAQPQKAAASAT